MLQIAVSIATYLNGMKSVASWYIGNNTSLLDMYDGGGTIAGSVVTWPTIATLAASSSQSFTLVVTAAAPGSYLNIVASSAATADPTPANNNGSAAGARVTTVVSPSADVSVAKAGPASGTIGQDVVYTVTVTNNGPTAAAAVVATDTLPAGVVFVSATGGDTEAGGVITWPAIGGARSA